MQLRKEPSEFGKLLMKKELVQKEEQKELDNRKRVLA